MIRTVHAVIRRQRLRPFSDASPVMTAAFGASPSLRTRQFHHDAKHDRLLVVGSGVAGSAAALIAAEVHRIPVTMLFAGQLPVDCNSNWAQGGIIYRNFDPSSGDSAEALAKDILRAGAGLCVDDAVQKVATQGPERVRQLLLDLTGKFAQVPFDRRDDGSLSLCLGTLLRNKKGNCEVIDLSENISYHPFPCFMKQNRILIAHLNRGVAWCTSYFA